MHLGDGGDDDDNDDDDEGGAVRVPLYPIVNHGRVVTEPCITCRDWFVSPGSCGADAQLYFKRRRPENGINRR